MLRNTTLEQFPPLFFIITYFTPSLNISDEQILAFYETRQIYCRDLASLETGFYA